jgi:FMN-dependent dehydrogenase
MSKSDLQARQIYHRNRDSIEAHPTIVFAALAVSRWIGAQAGWSIRKFILTVRRYRTIEIQDGQHTITQNGHGDLATAEAAARAGIPMIASTLAGDPMEEVAARFGGTPGFFQLYTPDRPGTGGEPGVPRRGRGFPWPRGYPRHLADRLAAAGPGHQQLPAAARALPGQLLHRPGVPGAARPQPGR